VRKRTPLLYFSLLHCVSRNGTLEPIGLVEFPVTDCSAKSAEVGYAMDTLSWLIVGHMLGDWVLQNHWMARGKLSGLTSLPLAVHCNIYALVVSAAVALIAHLTLLHMIAVYAVLLFSHWLVDGLQLAKAWGRIGRQSDSELVRIGVDQTFHLLVLAGIAVWLNR